MLERSYRDESSPETIQLYKGTTDKETDTFGYNCQISKSISGCNELSQEYFSLKVKRDTDPDTENTQQSFQNDGDAP
jgi:hypothetical protein